MPAEKVAAETIGARGLWKDDRQDEWDAFYYAARSPSMEAAGGRVGGIEQIWYRWWGQKANRAWALREGRKMWVPSWVVKAQALAARQAQIRAAQVASAAAAQVPPNSPSSASANKSADDANREVERSSAGVSPTMAIAAAAGALALVGLALRR